MSKEAVEGVTAPHLTPNEWFTIEEAAALVKVPARRMRRWVYAGTVRSTVLPGGRGRRVSGAALNEAMSTEALPASYRV